MYLSSVLDNFSRYIIACKLCTNMRAEDVTDTLDLALAASDCDSATVRHKLRLLSDNGPGLTPIFLAQRLCQKCQKSFLALTLSSGSVANPRWPGRCSIIANRDQPDQLTWR